MPTVLSRRSTRSDIYARPDVYDMEYEGASNQDAHFLARLLARVRPRRVLELGCGSGRVTFTMAAALPMAEIVGVDSSVDMLGKAIAARDDAEPLVRERVSLVEGDMRDWTGAGGIFDAVVIPCCAVSHLLTLDDRCRTWANAFRLLRPGGVFILDVRMPDLATLAEAQRARSDTLSFRQRSQSPATSARGAGLPRMLHGPAAAAQAPHYREAGPRYADAVMRCDSIHAATVRGQR